MEGPTGGGRVQKTEKITGKNDPPPSKGERGTVCVTGYSASIAPVGQVPSQAPQSMQALASICI